MDDAIALEFGNEDFEIRVEFRRETKVVGSKNYEVTVHAPRRDFTLAENQVAELISKYPDSIGTWDDDGHDCHASPDDGCDHPSHKGE